MKEPNYQQNGATSYVKFIGTSNKKYCFEKVKYLYICDWLKKLDEKNITN